MYLLVHVRTHSRRTPVLYCERYTYSYTALYERLDVPNLSCMGLCSGQLHRQHINRSPVRTAFG